MPSEPAPTTTEMQLDALSAAYGLPAEAVVEVALHNLTVLASFQMSREEAPEAIYRLLLAPALGTAESKELTPKRASTTTESDVLTAAAAFTEPFSSRDLASKTGRHAGAVGQVLSAAGWPCEPTRPGEARRWLPRPAQPSSS